MQRSIRATARVIRLVTSLAIVVYLSTRAQAALDPEKTLTDFARTSDVATVTPVDAVISTVASRAGTALEVRTGHRESWPGVTIKASESAWDLGQFDEVTLQLKNTGTSHVIVYCRIDNPGADGTLHCVTDSLGLDPGRDGILRVKLKRASDSQLGGKLFGMRGYPVAAGGPGTLDPTKVNQLLVFVSKRSSDHLFQIERVRASGLYVAPTAWTTDANPFIPFIDTFGQYKHKDWPGKVHSLRELQDRVTEEAAELSRAAGPADWDEYGGWASGPQLEGTGFFRTERHEGKWWLVDPKGRLFFSQGVDCVRARDVTPVEDRESWFEQFPGELTEFEQFLVPKTFALHGHYAGREPRSFTFGEANLLRKYGPEWRRSYPELIHRRLRSWGLNSIGMWSDAGTFQLRRTPYVDAIGSRGVRNIQGSQGYWGKFPDVWDSAFAEQLRQGIRSKAGKSAGDPWCLGYFADNEMSWGDENSLALAALRSPPDQPAKIAFLADLKQAYGDIEKLNSAWATTHASWAALLQSTNAPTPNLATRDLASFYTRTAEKYFRTVREVIKERAPNQLYLGCRFAWVNPRAAAAAAKYCDVVSYNLYRRSVADFQFNGGADVPLIIGEFHFGALDRGLFHTGLVPVRDQAARARAYREYVEGALRHPAFVGCHWFQYQDEPTTGRVYDEENYQIGFVDGADTPYVETIAACRQVAATMYQIRSSQQPSTGVIP